jgi:hypothetical protein
MRAFLAARPAVADFRTIAARLARLLAFGGLVAALAWMAVLALGHVPLSVRTEEIGQPMSLLTAWWGRSLFLAVFSLFVLVVTQGLDAPAKTRAGKVANGVFMVTLALAVVAFAMAHFWLEALTKPAAIASTQIIEDYASVSHTMGIGHTPELEAAGVFGPDGQIVESQRESRCATANAVIAGFSDRHLKNAGTPALGIAALLDQGLAAIQLSAGCITQGQWQARLVQSKTLVQEALDHPGINRFVMLGWTPGKGWINAERFNTIVLGSARPTVRKNCLTLTGMAAARQGLGNQVVALDAYCSALPNADKVATTPADFELPSGWEKALVKKG